MFAHENFDAQPRIHKAAPFFLMGQKQYRESVQVRVRPRVRVRVRVRGHVHVFACMCGDEYVCMCEGVAVSSVP